MIVLDLRNWGLSSTCVPVKDLPIYAHRAQLGYAFCSKDQVLYIPIVPLELYDWLQARDLLYWLGIGEVTLQIFLNSSQLDIVVSTLIVNELVIRSLIAFATA